MKGTLRRQSVLLLSMMQFAHLYAGTFHTIIGPDGRPIVVQKSTGQNSKLSKNKMESSSIKDQVSTLSNNLVSSQNKVEVQALNEKDSPIKKYEELGQTTLLIKDEKISLPTSHIENHQSTVQKDNTNPVLLAQPKANSIQPTHIQTSQNQFESPAEILEIEGEQYVRNEVLEEREFNFEGKKRFYSMPEGIIDSKSSATRFQTVEREKGVGKSVMQTLFKKKQQEEKEPLSLAATYYRISAETAVDGLGRSCFTDKKLKKAKDISVNQQVNLWPRTPLNNEFDFEVIKLQQPIQNIQIQSFASRQNDPTFYWPFVVFLDHEGCVLEGAGGFKNNEIAADYFRHANIEGIIQVPKNSHYVLLTPLASAIDVEDHVLSNQGQVKLTGIR